MTTYVFYEDSGQFKAERVLSQAQASLQVEADTGRRSKIRSANVLFEFDTPSASELMAQAPEMAATLEVDFLWECAPQDDIDAAAFAQDYFGHTPSAVEKAAMIMALHEAPVYFHRRGKGRYRAAPPDILEAALAALEKKRQQEELQQTWVEQMVNGELPEAIAPVAATFLTRPDKNSLQWKAFEAALKELNIGPEQLLLRLKVWPHALALHRERFIAQHFPKGTGFGSFSLPSLSFDLPQAKVTAYSIDDRHTTEVDDALSVSIPQEGIVQVGVHIAAPALAFTRDSALDQIARERMATVYMPGERINMLPQEVIQAFSLKAGEYRPALSLYAQFDLTTGNILTHETVLESLCVAQNLDHQTLVDSVTQEALEDPEHAVPYGDFLRPLWQVAKHLMQQREAVRGKPESNNRVDYSFELDGPADNPDTPVHLVARLRDAPLDLLVAEYMILANNLWGALLHERGLPGIYRSQQVGRVRMTTHPLPHDTIGVAQYAWSTAPLRRYVDLINQSQVIAAAQHGVSARLVAPFKPRDADLFAIISAFDAQYAAWRAHQNTMERYWCLRWLQQNNKTTVEASVLRDDLVRLVDAPLVTRVAGLPELDRGRIVRLDILGYDELSLELHCRFHETICL